MALLTDLPNELLQNICNVLYQESPRTVPALSQTCKRVYQLAHRTFSTHICLEWHVTNRSQLVRFANNNLDNDAVRSIRLVPSKEQLAAMRANMPNAYEQLDPLRACLPTLSKLTTFSIDLDLPRLDRGCRSRVKAISQILLALPSSVVNLELDMICMDGIGHVDDSTKEDFHLCEILGAILPRLETLFLRLSGMCMRLFDLLTADGPGQTTARLRRGSIKLGGPYHKEGLLGGFPIIHECDQQCTGVRDRTKRPLDTKRLSRHLLDLRLQGAFPYLERFVVQTHERERPEGWVRFYDVASGAEHVPQFGCNFDIRNSPMVGYQHDSASILYGFRWYQQMEKTMLHDVMWRGGDGHARLPPVTSVQTRLKSDTGGLKPSPWASVVTVG